MYFTFMVSLRIALPLLLAFLFAVPAAAAGAPSTLDAADAAMLQIADSRAAGLPAGGERTFGYETGDSPWLCDAEGDTDVEGPMPRRTYVASTEADAKGRESIIEQDISVYRGTAAARAAFAKITMLTRRCAGVVTHLEDETTLFAITRTNGASKTVIGGRPMVWVAQDAPDVVREFEYTVFALVGSTIQTLELEHRGAQATPVGAAERKRVDRLAVTLAKRWQAG
jgi:hypothetical protein